MKKYLMFIGSFIVLFLVFTLIMELVSGFFLTSSYTPNVDEAWHMGGHAPGHREMGFSRTFINLPFWVAIISATLSYWVSNKLAN